MSYHCFTPKYHPLAQAVTLALFASISLHATAADTNTLALPETQIDTIVITAKPEPESQNKDITNLGQITKTAETLKQQQVESIRDLTRYDAGVAVNESVGRGTSTGFSIRGAEKERVAVMVDGLSQGETIKLYGNGSGVESGAKNEVEYENLKLVEISKGVNSTYAGSGALGGAVMMQTKDASDFIHNQDKNWGGRVKVGYTSKDQRKVASVGIGGQVGGWEGFIQYTKRAGHELKPHDDVYNLPPTTVSNVITHANSPLIQKVRTVIDSDPKKSYTYNEFDPVDRQLKALNLKIADVQFSADELSGPERRVPNPMDYESNSFLSKLGYHFNNEHYVGAVLEDTKQRYDVRNMFKHQYYKDGWADNKSNKPPYMPIRSNMVGRKTFKDFPEFKTPIMYDFYQNTPAAFFTDIHHNKRYGLEYKYTPTNTNIIDELTANIDKQQLTISSNDDLVNCTKWPSVDRNCDSTPEPGQYISNDKYDRIFDTKRIDIQAKKSFKIGETTHNLSFATGYKDTDYQGSKLEARKSHTRYTDTKNPKTTQTDVLLKEAFNVTTDKIEKDILVNRYYPIMSKLLSRTDTGKQDVQHKGYFIGLNNNIHLTDRLDLTLGARYDVNKFESSLSKQPEEKDKYPKFNNSDFKNTSYNLGLAYLPIDNLELTYKYSTGFRVPSIGEQLGFTPIFDNTDTLGKPQPKLKAEIAKSHDIGATYYTDFGYITGSYFRNDYDDFIAYGIPVDDVTKLGYFNQQGVKIHGFDVSSEIYLDTLWQKIPVGLQANLSVGMVKMREQPQRNPDYQAGQSYALDMVQPLRVIYGLSYNEPSNKWGVALNTTYSAEKDPNELTFDYRSGGLSGKDNTANVTAPAWTVTDLTGHYQVKDNITLRGGIYNIFNHHYSTWEALRQLKDIQESHATDAGSQLLVAPGRNYGLSLEFTF